MPGGSEAGEEPRSAQGTSGRATESQNAQSRNKVQQKLAEQRRREQQRQRQRRGLWMAGVATAVVITVTVTMVIISRTVQKPRPPAKAVASGQAAVAVARKATSVPPTVFDQVGVGAVMAAPTRVTDQAPLTADGKPLIVYIGAEYCPFCASQRWAVVIALARFGTFSDLGLTHSASEDVYPNTPSFSFHGATYTSEYLAFQGVELTTNERQGNGYAPLDTLTPQQEKLMETLNAPPYVKSSGAIPFLDMGNRYVMVGGAFDPQPLQDKTAEQIADVLSNSEDPIAKAVLGTANMITAHACHLTDNQPAEVCSSTAVTAFQELT